MVDNFKGFQHCNLSHLALSVQEIRTLVIIIRNCIIHCHGQSSTVDNVADVAIQIDINKIMLAGLMLVPCFLGPVFQINKVRLSMPSHIIKSKLGIQCEELALIGANKQAYFQ